MKLEILKLEVNLKDFMFFLSLICLCCEKVTVIGVTLDLYFTLYK